VSTVHTAITGSDYAIASDPPPAHKGDAMGLFKEIAMLPINMVRAFANKDFDPRSDLSKEIDRLDAVKICYYERLMSLGYSKDYLQEQLFGLNKDIVFLKSDLKSMVENGNAEDAVAEVRAKLAAKEAKRQLKEDEVAAMNVAIDAQRQRYEVVCYDRRNVGERFDQKEKTCQQ
jgi:hypothetical protein